MSYIKFGEGRFYTIDCSHPKVKKIWEHGYCAATPGAELKKFYSIQLDDGSIHEFEDDGNGKAIEDAENFLKQLQ